MSPPDMQVEEVGAAGGDEVSQGRGGQRGLVIDERSRAVLAYQAIDIDPAFGKRDGARGVGRQLNRKWRVDPGWFRHAGATDCVDGLLAHPVREDVDQLVSVGVQVHASLLLEHSRKMLFWLKRESREGE